jgi:esterase
VGFIPSHIEVRSGSAEPTRAALVVHGMLGSGANWRSFIRRLVDTDPGAARFRWILVDLRHHGDSALTVAPAPHTVRACAEDLRALEASLGVEFELVFGHSFGGKVALEYARLREVPPRGVWILDTPLSAEAGAAGRSEIGRVLGALRALGEPLPGRAELQDKLEAAGLSRALAQWMTTNLRGNAEVGYRWKFDLDGCEALIEDYFSRDLWGLAEQLAGRTRLHCVRGGRSDRFSADEVRRLEDSPGIFTHVIEDAGHWLHVDAPEALRVLFFNGVSEIGG